MLKFLHSSSNISKYYRKFVEKWKLGKKIRFFLSLLKERMIVLIFVNVEMYKLLCIALRHDMQ